MNELSISNCWFCILALLLSACSTPSAVDDSAGSVNVLHAARQIHPVTRNESTQTIDNFADSVIRGEPLYDASFQAWSSDGTPAQIDCTNVRSIGVVLRVDTKDVSPTLRRGLRLRYTWSHSSLDFKGPRFDYYRSGLQKKRGVKKGFSASELEILRMGLLVDGVFTVSVTHFGNEVHRDSFNLVGCSDQAE